MGVISKAYLILYNLTLTIGWAYVAYLAWQKKDDHTKMWKAVELPLKIFQSAALLEVCLWPDYKSYQFCKETNLILFIFI